MIQRLDIDQVGALGPWVKSVAVLSVDDSSAGGAPTVAAGDLHQALAGIDPIPLAAFVYPADDHQLELLAAMLEAVNGQVDTVAIRSVPAVDALKRVRDNQVVEAIDRSLVRLLASPELINRAKLAAAAAALDVSEPVNPTMLMSSTGHPLQLVEL